MSSSPHIPVLAQEVLTLLNPQPGMTILDLTVGAGGHASKLLPLIGSNGRYIGCDRDPYALTLADKTLRKHHNYELIQSNFSDLEQLVSRAQIRTLDALLVDLGVSSMQLDMPHRGFSYKEQGPLDLRMDPSLEVTGADVVNTYEPSQLTHLFSSYGELPHSKARMLTDFLCESRVVQPIETTGELSDLIDKLPKKRGKTYAPQVFQALRIEVNGELDALSSLLTTIPSVLSPGGRACIISFHSLEDRMVKQAFRKGVNPCTCPPRTPVCVCGETPYYELLTRRAVKPTLQEIHQNPRSRSARLRAVKRISSI